MTEQLLRIEGPDQNGIYGKIRKAGHRKLVVHIHGMTHSMNHMLEVMAADFFPNCGYDHYRMSLYERVGDSRTLASSTLTTHVSDVRAVLDYFSGQYDSIFLSAHSLGGLVAMIVNPQDIAAMSLWDPSTDVSHFWTTRAYLTHMPERSQYQLNYGNVFVIGEDMVDEIKAYPDARCLDLAKQITTPTQMIIPEATIFAASPHASPENYRHAFAGDFELTHIKGASHTFSNEGNPHELFQHARQWFDKHGESEDALK